ncbi:hypothetical protein N8I77_003525 [Diaporthe amygdali]|uniref:Uncharacterized protein n=1 Tax=Phomopsis amygdali TaxID=1214568 RepID=A0AAD9SJF9_PHOAM|nr:hypothetical protein N8I77_003525 [Diaporthe amygdali]
MEDIEIAINASDQQRVFEILSSHGLSISSPDHQSATPSSFEEWFKNAPSSSPFHDRRRTRLLTPIYELPATGNPLDDMLRPFIIVYSAEEVGLPLISPPTSSTETKPTEAYITLSVLNPDLALCNNAFSSKETRKSQVMDSMIPSFTSLVKSEMHVLLMHAEVHSPVWGQHMAQLSELVYSRACADGPDNLQEVVANASFKEFISWFRASLKGEADYETLESLRASYREVYQLQDD